MTWASSARAAQAAPGPCRCAIAATGYLQWNDLGSLAIGEKRALWVEFEAARACGETVNRARAEGSGVFDEHEASVRLLEHTARIAGRVCHDQNNDNQRLGSGGPAGW